MDNWKHSYKQMLSSLNYSRDSIEKMIHPPNRLFKYRNFDANDYWKSWIKGEVVANSPNTFNDPFDCVFVAEKGVILQNKNFIETINDVFKRKSINKLSKIDKNRIEFSENKSDAIKTILSQRNISYRNEIWEPLLNMNKMVTDTIKSTIRISCFSEINDSILMWSHYSENHKGFCIEYDFTLDSLAIDSIFPVLYSNKRYDCKSDFDNEDKIWILKTIFSKSNVWDYEKEWRFIVQDIYKMKGYDTSKTTFYLPVIENLKAIYLGAKISDENMESIIKLAEENSIKNIYKMELSDTEYNLIAKKIDI